MSDERPLSERLQGIADSLTVRMATLLAQSARARLSPELMDELRHWAGVAVRGAAIEGARSPAATLGELLPVPKSGRAMAQEMTATRRDTPDYSRGKLPSGV